MSRRYRLDTKIKALNLLDQYDGDFQLVGDELDIPVKTLASWRRAEADLRQRFYDRQQHHFYNVKFALLAKMLGGCEAIMKQMHDKAIEEASLSQRANTLSILLKSAVGLEEAFEELEEKDRMEQEEPNRGRFIYDGGFQDAPPWAADDPETPGAVQGGRLRKALGQVGVGANSDPESGSLQKQALLVDCAHVSDGESDLA